MCHGIPVDNRTTGTNRKLSTSVTPLGSAGVRAMWDKWSGTTDHQSDHRSGFLTFPQTFPSRCHGEG